nr:serine/arginine repetitive matrix protein 1-like [Aegilops tauschii subsp. strangulata]
MDRSRGRAESSTKVATRRRGEGRRSKRAAYRQADAGKPAAAPVDPPSCHGVGTAKPPRRRHPQSGPKPRGAPNPRRRPEKRQNPTGTHHHYRYHADGDGRLRPRAPSAGPCRLSPCRLLDTGRSNARSKSGEELAAATRTGTPHRAPDAQPPAPPTLTATAVPPRPPPRRAALQNRAPPRRDAVPRRSTAMKGKMPRRHRRRPKARPCEPAAAREGEGEGTGGDELGVASPLAGADETRHLLQHNHSCPCRKAPAQCRKGTRNLLVSTDVLVTRT